MSLHASLRITRKAGKITSLVREESKGEWELGECR